MRPRFWVVYDKIYERWKTRTGWTNTLQTAQFFKDVESAEKAAQRYKRVLSLELQMYYLYTEPENRIPVK